ncbi:MAG: hypothetical protein DLM65_01690 [Candidatus Aeolococcus gillhamiae]|uniref:Uncharacterized protein n=1 Tax=Candidatus Aeolococcus gillhamiae TaxID=3127015 RepID=A0A2W5ZDF0_9BACT|nr:MAG: hypothetical protein DLM65_01690 [Candidatus Dormibacter sp. RRmetagenome_bin12]
MLRDETASRIDERDRGLSRATQLRLACAVGAAASTAVIAYLAAGSVPGRASVSNSAGQTSSGTDLSPATAPGLTPPQQAPGAGGDGGGQFGSAPIVTGGS